MAEIVTMTLAAIAAVVSISAYLHTSTCWGVSLRFRDSVRHESEQPLLDGDKSAK